MEIIKTKDRTFIEEFEEVNTATKAKWKYSFLKNYPDNSKEEQLKILTKLEQGLPLFSGKSFADQVHFQFAEKVPIQRWFPYREGYSIELVKKFIKELKINGNVFDPFVGSGTTLLASRMNGLNSFGIDVNPISVFIARVENERYKSKDIIRLEEEISELANLKKFEENSTTNFPLADKVFNKEILQALLQFKQYINSINHKKVKDIFFLTWLSVIESVSNIKKEGNGIKYKNRKRTRNGYINIEKEKWEEDNFPTDKHDYVKTKIINHLSTILFDLKLNYGSCNNKPSIYQGSCLDFDNFFQDELELTFFSPPYCNCFDYFEIHKVELWLGGFISEKDELRKLRNTGFRSNTNALKNRSVAYNNEFVERLIVLFNSKKLWNKNIPNVVRGYFDDMHLLLSRLYKQTLKKGFVGVVVGNSAYSGVIIPTDILIAEIAREIGFDVKGIIVTRHLTTSSQQKRQLDHLKHYLRESIVLLQK